ncbi:unnamed protein product [Diatraea saccharalis]|uniref:Major facilitator superfamily (MFS) profile domain-containing protein n=1 Tax=Diatraea saccharalis TaxID=40085 RepID=A0A9N9WDM2_9NEOP|nr:unnamed protein product [Diatraea saccharalis]
MTSDQDGILNKPSEYALSFEWSSQRQGVILSSFFWGYVILQIPGGELAAKFGSKLLIIICIAVNSAISILIPVSAGLGGWQLVCACRVLQGLSQGFLYPSMHNIIGKWIPLQEKSSLGTIIYSGTKVARQYYVSARCLVRSWSECVDVVAALGRCRAPLLLLFTPCPGLARVRAGSAHLGTALQLLVSGYIAQYWGWPAIFYVNGTLGILWTVFYIFIGSASPKTSGIISEEEKVYIETSLGHVGVQKKMKTPWKSICTSIPFIALIIAHCGQNWGFYTLLTEMPSYMKQVLGVDIKANGVMSALPYIAMYVLSFPLGFSADYILKKNWLSITACRKISNSIGQWGPALALIGLSYAPADTAIAVAILTAVVGLNAGHYTGYMLVHIDMSPNFAGPLMGITNCIANIISMIAPLIAGAILVDQSFFDWNSQRQGVILSSFLWGYVILKIPGGELAAKFGSKLLIIICIGVNSVVSMFIPISASLGGWQLVCACRVLQGLSQGFLYPSMHNIIGKWIPIQEKNSLGTIIYSVHFKDPIIRYSYKYRYS